MGAGRMPLYTRLDLRFTDYQFFFSSRRRHTSWPRDWSSDVCSSDLETASTAQGASVLLPEGEDSTQYPLTLETPFGHTVLDKCPERVAVVSAVGVDTESLLALDAVPVFAVAKYDGEDPWLPKDLWEQVEFTEQGDAGE